MKVLLYPGLLVQMITTKQPTDDMIEVAIVSMEQALEADGETVPTGSGDFARRPMEMSAPSDTTTDVPVPTAPPTVPALPASPPLPTDPPSGR
jgi:hypothetical protein